jgi:hypothetical protein
VTFLLGALNADYPQVCVGVYDRTTEFVSEVTNGEDELNLRYQLVDFNETGKLADLVNSDLYNTLRPLGETSCAQTYSDRHRRHVIEFKQLDRDTFFIAFENQVCFVIQDISIAFRL